MENTFLTQVKDVPVSLESLILSNIGRIHVLGVMCSGEQNYSGLSKQEKTALNTSVSAAGGYAALGKPGATKVHWVQEGKNFRYFVTVGLGEAKEWEEGPKDASKYDLLERVRAAVGDGYNAAHALAKQLSTAAKDNPEKIELSIAPLGLGLNGIFGDSEIFEAIADAALRSGYQGLRTFDTDRTGDSLISKVKLLVDNVAEFTAAFKHAYALASSENIARFMMEAPHNYMSPDRVVHEVRAVVNAHKSLNMEVVTKDELEKQNHPYAALWAIARASNEAALIKVSYIGNPSDKRKLAVVGKGITYDTGGYDLKRDGMADMNGDKGGAATVTGVMNALAASNVLVNIDFYIPVAENVIGETAIKSGAHVYLGNDADGKPFPPIEIANTDAEGRLVMATGVALAGLDKDVQAIIDVATLSGAQMIATGPYFSGAICNKHNPTAGMILDALLKAGEVSAEEFIHFPPHPQAAMRVTRKAEYPGAFATTGNSKWGGNIDGYSLLARLTSGKPLVHLDIAPVLEKFRRPYLGPEQRFGAPPVIALTRALETVAPMIYSAK